MQVLTPADDEHHINKHNFKAPFVCGCRDLGEALRRISEGAAMIRTKVSAALAIPCELLPQRCLQHLHDSFLAFLTVLPSRSHCLMLYSGLSISFACMQGEAGTGNVVEAVRHCRSVMGAIRKLQTMDDDELYVYAKELRAPIELVRQVSPIELCPGLSMNLCVLVANRLNNSMH